MKRNKLLTLKLLLLGMAIFSFSCNNEDHFETTNVENTTSEVLNTYTEKLGKNVDSIQEVTLNHPLVKKISGSINFNYERNTNAVIYNYSNNYQAVILEDVDNSTQNDVYIYAYLLDAQTKDLKDIMYTHYAISNQTKSTRKEISATMTSLITNNELVHYDSRTRASWGECMSDGMDLLYNDWTNDAMGTLSCWVTGYWCVVGGAIGCTIQTW